MSKRYPAESTSAALCPSNEHDRELFGRLVQLTTEVDPRFSVAAMIARAILDRGRFFRLGERPRPKGKRLGKLGGCLVIAQKWTLHELRDGWFYAEGYVLLTDGTILHHGWSEVDGVVAEPNLHPQPLAYAGISFTAKEIAERMMEANLIASVLAPLHWEPSHFRHHGYGSIPCLPEHGHPWN